MRVPTLMSALVLLAASSAVQAQGRPVPANPQVPKAEAKSAYTSEQSAAMADAAREKTEALERARDKRMKTLTRGICSGC